MASVGNVWANLRLNISDFASGLIIASRDLRRFAATQRDALKRHVGFADATATLRTFNRSLSDTINITRGIIISQTFYAIVGAIRDATNALWEFNTQLDYAHVTYTALFGDANLARDFMSVLQEHAIETIFDYQDLAGMSKKLLAYGIEYENLMFIMEGLTNLGAMSGDAASLDRISLALGQIYTKGKLSAEEMRQLANAYVPIAEIIQEKFGLTPDQMGRVGDLNLPAEDVINAIVDYANENFGNVGDAAMMTITGLQAKIVDTLKVVGSEMLQPITTAYKSFLAYIAEGLVDLRAEFASGGLGGVFEYLVPDEGTQAMIRTFIANARNMFMSFVSVGKVAGQVMREFAHVFIIAFNTIAPVVTTLTNALSSVLSAMISTRAGAAVLRTALLAAAVGFTVMRIQAVSALVITVVTKAVYALSKALMALALILVKHPIFALFALLGGALIGVASSSDAARNALSGFFDSFAGFGGSSGEDVLQRTNKELYDTDAALDQFNNRLADGSNAADDMAEGLDGVSDAAKKAKKTGDLLSFDEVFRLKDSTSGSDASGAGAGAGVLEDIEGLMDGLNSLGGALMPDIPDFSDYVNNFSNGLFGAFTGSGTFTNMLVGFGAGVAKRMGDALAKAGARFGFGTILKNAFKGGGIKGLFSVLAGTIETAGLKNLAKGGLIGAAIGVVTDAFANLLWKSLADNLNLSAAATGNATVGGTIGSIIGTIIGGLLGGPVGAIIGSVLGTFAGGFVGLFWEKIEEYFDPENNTLSKFCVDTAARLAEWWDGTKTGFTDWWQTTSNGFSTWWTDTWEGLSKWWNDTVNIFSDWDSITSETLGNWWSSTWDGFSTWWSDTWDGFSTWWSDTWDGLQTWAENNRRGYDEWRSDTFSTISGWTSDTWDKISGWYNDTMEKYKEWVRGVGDTLNKWADDMLRVIGGFCIAALKAFAQWCEDTAAAIGQWFRDLIDDIKQWWSNLWNPDSWEDGWGMVDNWFSDLLTDIGDWFRGIGTSVKNWWSGLWDGLDTPDVSGGTFSGGGGWFGGHATGGVFNREHIARFAEGNKAEAIIPLENSSAMQPFVDAVSSGVISSLAPVLVNNAGSSNSLPPLYVGTLIADDRGLKELYRRFEVIQLQEDARRGYAT